MVFNAYPSRILNLLHLTCLGVMCSLPLTAVAGKYNRDIDIGDKAPAWKDLQRSLGIDHDHQLSYYSAVDSAVDLRTPYSFAGNREQRKPCLRKECTWYSTPTHRES